VTDLRLDDPRLSKPSTKKGRTERVVLRLLLDHERNQGLPTTVRFVFYELEQRGEAAPGRSWASTHVPTWRAGGTIGEGETPLLRVDVDKTRKPLEVADRLREILSLPVPRSARVIDFACSLSYL
jgi:hypothetical protein